MCSIACGSWDARPTSASPEHVEAGVNAPALLIRATQPSLLDRLEAVQNALLENAARQSGRPSTAIIRNIAELENANAAVLALIEERQGRR